MNTCGEIFVHTLLVAIFDFAIWLSLWTFLLISTWFIVSTIRNWYKIKHLKRNFRHLIVIFASLTSPTFNIMVIFTCLYVWIVVMMMMQFQALSYSVDMAPKHFHKIDVLSFQKMYGGTCHPKMVPTNPLAHGLIRIHRILVRVAIIETTILLPHYLSQVTAIRFEN